MDCWPLPYVYNVLSFTIYDKLCIMFLFYNTHTNGKSILNAPKMWIFDPKFEKAILLTLSFLETYGAGYFALSSYCILPYFAK